VTGRQRGAAKTSRLRIVPTVFPKLLGGPDAAGAQRAMQAMLQMVRLDIAALKKAYDG
jgi:hypothetical protein